MNKAAKDQITKFKSDIFNIEKTVKKLYKDIKEYDNQITDLSNQIKKIYNDNSICLSCDSKIQYLYNGDCCEECLENDSCCD